MCPETALVNILADHCRADHVRSLNEWLARGGYAPRVRLHPATDAWMMGDRYGDLVKVGRKYLHVRMDRSGRIRKVLFDDATHRETLPAWIGGIA